MKDSSSVVYYLQRINRGPRPERADEQAHIARASNGDREALELLISSNLAYIVHFAKGFRGRGLPFEDLIAEGCVGLLKAIGRYRAENGTRFMTYASFWVRKQILAAIADQPQAIHVPRYARQHGHDAVRVVRLDVPRNADGNVPLADRLRHPGPLPSETIIDTEQELQIRRHVRRLPLRDRAVIVWRYGLGGRPEQTLNEIAHRLGLSRERVRQIEVSALARLRDVIVNRSRCRSRRHPPVRSERPDRIVIAGAHAGT